MTEESDEGLSEKTKNNLKQLKKADEELEKMEGVPAEMLAVHAQNKMCVAYQIIKDTDETLQILQERFPWLEIEFREAHNEISFKGH